MHILVTGAHGQLANEIRRCIEIGEAEIAPIPAPYASAEVDYIDIEDVDLSDAAALDEWLEKRQAFDLIINCAAMTNVDGCESDFATAFAANALAPMNLARACKKMGAKLVHVSTDYVFPGTDAVPRTENDVPAPLSAYGRSKLAGEGLALAANPRSFVFRTAWLYGYVGRNFVKTMLSLGASHDHVSVVDDQLGNPTSANDVAYEILTVAVGEQFGIYHCTNEGTCSWADFTEAIMSGRGLKCRVERCSSAEWKAAHPQSADRPAYSSLANDHLAETVGNEMRDWRDALTSYLDHYDELAR